MKRELTIAMLHAAIAHRRVDENRKHLLAMMDRAAINGADLIMTPEMALTGYSFDGRKEIVPLAETIDGPTVTAVGEMAKTHGVWICVGLALAESDTGILTNSAIVLDSDGKIVCRYDKINAESRWACPGAPHRDNTFDTPWGRMGLLICSDTYHGLMPRVTALRGADLLLVPANWPPSGLDPRELWQTRALENGCHLVACNRTGIDLTMDCRQASAVVVDPHGGIALHEKSEGSKTFTVHIPLSPMGRIDDTVRRLRLADRRPRQYHDCYLNMRPIRNLTSFLGLPAPGVTCLTCIIPEEDEHPVAALGRYLRGSSDGTADLIVLPAFAYSDKAIDDISRLVQDQDTEVIARRSTTDANGYLLWTAADGACHRESASRGDAAGKIDTFIDFKTARLAPLTAGDLMHPEPFVAAAKRGCDLAVIFDDRLSPEKKLLAGARTIENLAVAACGNMGAGIWMAPEGHGRWEEFSAGPGETCRHRLDTSRMRQKRFQDDIDFRVLLAP